MKKLFKLVTEISKKYKDFRVIVTKDMIEVKFIPERDSDNEVVFVSTLSARRLDMITHLEMHLYVLNNPNP